MILIILIFLILIYLVKVSNNHDIIKEHCKTEENKANVKNAKKVFNKTKYSSALLILSLLSLIIIIICQFTKLDTIIIDYFSVDFYTEDFFNINYYYLPAFLFISRQIIIEVKISEFLHKYFEVVEEEVNSADLIKNILYKKKPTPEEKTDKASKSSPENKEESANNNEQNSSENLTDNETLTTNETLTDTETLTEDDLPTLQTDNNSTNQK